MNNETNKPRGMTVRGFIAKTNTKAALSAGAFIQQYREYLTTGELADITSPIIKKLDDKEILPTPALQLIQAAAFGHMIALDTIKLEQIDAGAAPGSSKKWTAVIKNGKGQVCTRVTNDGDVEDLLKTFDLAQEGSRWVDRRLFDGASDWYGEIEGLGILTRVERSDAMARVLKTPKGATMHQRSQTTASLSFGVKAHQTRCSFSKG